MQIVSSAITRTRKSRGRPKGDAISIHLRAPADLVAAVDAFMAERADSGETLTRPEAVRRLTAEALQKMGLLDIRG